MKIFSPTFSGSVQLEDTFKTDLSNNLTGSLDQFYTRSGSFSAVSSSITSEISGLDSRLGTLEGKTLVSSSNQISYTGLSNIPVGILSSSAQIASDISGSFTAISASFASNLTGLDNRLDTLEGKTLLSSSNQIAGEISGAFTSTSSSIAFDISGLDSRLDSLEGKTLLSSSVQVQLSQISGTTFSSSNFIFPENLTVQGTLTAEKYYTEYITSSVIYESGSTKFGNSYDDIHQFTGSVRVNGGITGSLLGEASAVEFSNVLNKPSLVSSSAQITYSGITGKPSGIVSSSNQIDEYMIIAVSDEVTPLTAGIAKLTFRVPHRLNLYDIPRASLTSGSTSGNVVLDINSGSVSILGGTKLTIDQGQKTSTTSTSQTSLVSTVLTDDAEITVDVDSAGTSATGVKVTLYYRKG